MKHSSSRIIAFLSAAVCSAAMAGNVCNWTGGAADGKWSSPSNWDTRPVSGNGDELVFDTSSAAIVTENDIEGFDIAKITISGGNDITINGERILIKSGADGTSENLATVLEIGKAKLVITAPMTIDTDYCQFYQSVDSAGRVTVNGDLEYLGVGTFRLRSARWRGTPAMEFNGDVTAANGFVNVFPNAGGGLPTVCFNGKVTAKEFGLSNYTGNWGGDVTIGDATASYSAIDTLHSAYGFLCLKDENVFSENGVLKTGWRTVNGKRKYFEPESGKPVLGAGSIVVCVGAGRPSAVSGAVIGRAHPPLYIVSGDPQRLGAKVSTAAIVFCLRAFSSRRPRIAAGHFHLRPQGELVVGNGFNGLGRRDRSAGACQHTEGLEPGFEPVGQRLHQGGQGHGLHLGCAVAARCGGRRVHADVAGERAGEIKLHHVVAAHVLLKARDHDGDILRRLRHIAARREGGDSEHALVADFPAGVALQVDGAGGCRVQDRGDLLVRAVVEGGHLDPCHDGRRRNRV